MKTANKAIKHEQANKQAKSLINGNEPHVAYGPQYIYFFLNNKKGHGFLDSI